MAIKNIEDTGVKVKVLDAICGAGKTSLVIQEINDMYSKEGFNKNIKSVIFVTPYLNEIERVIKSCPNADFKQPDNKNYIGSKLVSLKQLITNGENIATTHSLFKLIDAETLNLLRGSGYILILDEVLNVLNEVVITKSDMKYLLDSTLFKIEGKTLKWLDSDYSGKFNDIKHMAEIGNIHYYREKYLFWTITPESFEVFDEVYILTYMFKGQLQRYFYDMHNIKYEMRSVVKNNGRYELVEYDDKLDNREQLKDLINVYEDNGKSKLNSNYAKRITDTQFSSTWLKNADTETLEIIRKNINTFFKNTCKVKSSECFWTTIKKLASKLKNRGYNTYKEDDEKEGKNMKHNFVPFNIRATNDYSHCTACAYAYNRFMNPIEKAFYQDNGVTVNENALALSDLVQLLFRGCIRKGQPMSVYIPSKRMRNLLYDWFEYKI